MFNNPEKKLFDLLYSLWEKGKNHTEDINNYYQYWDGKLFKFVPANSHFSDQKKTSCNVIKQIVEAKLTAMLDAKFTPQVVPVIYALSDAKTIKNQQLVADTFNCEMNNVLNRNYFDDLQEKIGRWGLIAGYGVSQTTWSDDEDIIGQIKIENVDPEYIRYDKDAKKIEDTTFIAYQIELNPQIAKKRYAQNSDGTYNERLSKAIDRIAGTSSTNELGKVKNVSNVTSSETTQQAYTYESQNIQAGKIVKLIVMFVLDNSIYLDEEKDDRETKELKKVWKMKYPNGRMIVMSADDKEKFILDDKAAPESFKSLGNIDFFNPIDFNSLTGKGEVEDLIPIQDRINGAYLKIRNLIANHINSLLLDKGLDDSLTGDDLVAYGVNFLDGIGRQQGNTPPLLNNQSIQEAMRLLEYVRQLKEEAYETARLNETMLFGTQQTGTKSGDQVEALQESPMGGIRSLQRNFKTMVIKIGEKIINLILEHYNVQRMIKLSGMKDFKYAKFMQKESSMGDSTTVIEYYDEKGEVKESIEIDKQWKFAVEVTAGTEIPRSRRENSMIIERLFAQGVLGDPNDLDLKEQYLRALDLPNYRAYMDIMRAKASEPPKTDAVTVLSNPVIAKAVADFIKALDKNSRAKGQILQSMGLDPATDTLDEAPIQDVTSKSDVKEVVAINPSLASSDAQGQMRGQVVAGAEIDVEKGREVSI